MEKSIEFVRFPVPTNSNTNECFIILIQFEVSINKISFADVPIPAVLFLAKVLGMT